MPQTENLSEHLSNHLRGFDAAPFLFIGSGFSRRYINLEIWEQLLRKFAAETGKPYEYFRSSANNDFPAIGSKLAAEFHEIWWKEARYSESRSMFGGNAVSTDSALKIEISQYLKEVSKNLPNDQNLAAELNELKEGVIDGIITTNWDFLLESLFPDFKSFIGQEELLFSAPMGIGEIYKIHGCCSKPNSLVLTSEDYDRFSNRNPYLAAKLLATFVEHPIIFLGYSLNDPNVGQILKSIASCLTNSNLHQLQDRLIFIEWSDTFEDKSLKQTVRIIDNHSIPLCLAKVNSFMPVFEALSLAQRRFPAKLLRQLKEHVYELVRTSDPKDQIFVEDIDADEANLSKLNVVFGVGTEVRSGPSQTGVQGYKLWSRNDLLLDILDDNAQFDAKLIVNDTFPHLTRGNVYLPLFKYLRAAGNLDDEGNVIAEEVHPRIKATAEKPFSRFHPPQYYVKKLKTINAKYKSFKKLRESSSLHDILYYGLLIHPENIEINVLENFLKENRSLLEEKTTVECVQYIKMICALDYLKYKALEKPSS